MYIISDIYGNILQTGSNELDEVILNSISSSLNKQLVVSNDEVLFKKNIELKKCKAIIANNEIIDVVLDETKLNLDFENLKISKIVQTKQQLAEFLETNHLLYNNEYYSITQEKQALLTSAISAYQLKVQANVPAVLKWNTAGDICREFTLEEITGLVITITDYVQPRVEKQQALEIQIKNCITIDELDNITIDYEVI